jgi:hypothetical protein
VLQYIGTNLWGKWRFSFSKGAFFEEWGIQIREINVIDSAQLLQALPCGSEMGDAIAVSNG